MRFVSNNGCTDPFLNLALEAYLLRSIQAAESYFLLYVNRPAVVIGRNQNIFQETNPDFLARQHIDLVRRVSGGGTVYHDRGNLNFSFIVPGRQDIHRFERFTKPVLAVLKRLGVTAVLHPNGSLFVGDQKISGHAQYAATSHLLSHGTLLFDADTGSLSAALKPQSRPLESNGVASIRSPVVNLRPLLPPQITLDSLQQAILEEVLDPQQPAYDLTSADWDRIQALATGTYTTWDWIYGRNPRFVLENKGHCTWGTVTSRVEVKNGRIHHWQLTADFEPEHNFEKLTASIQGVRYERTAVLSQLSRLNLAPYFGKIDQNELLRFLF